MTDLANTSVQLCTINKRRENASTQTHTSIQSSKQKMSLYVHIKLPSDYARRQGTKLYCPTDYKNHNNATSSMRVGAKITLPVRKPSPNARCADICSELVLMQHAY
ncbi:hypothetical protein IscW_ISCW021387 [Ixodes scapularis]|uniref:Uncharacterized protein n=1 Tax=Ixodes scapularis TaxID=6945 RepID=B7Q689_IXOSC|nr:hypothetical protein IscW_ISCW021387 [Ixodes scapularis]|eukprot:XP_002411905.1 hypothetical protein IscW_ISCW021387 [Ixodes scapularis]